ncbi:hypothetical protein SLE2022_385530 [Rubroshorea leprosula]|uniref:DUF1677 family protein n=1 Tax=Rubroshorea leprosula TaxID=152421 RepID=A0AAV5MD94_9ROSI|nr:hypothetical protein SLEP1_g54538 [Rubroshorea leprosula]
MSATIISDPMMIPVPASAPETQLVAQIEVEFAECDCCGLTEECTPAYIERVRQIYLGKWICGLCAEAVKDETIRTHESLITTEEALTRHMNFCKKSHSSGPPPDPTVHLISAMRQILRRSLDSPRAVRSTPSSPTRKVEEIRPPGLSRTGSCFSSLAG